MKEKDKNQNIEVQQDPVETSKIQRFKQNAAKAINKDPKVILITMLLLILFSIYQLYKDSTNQVSLSDLEGETPEFTISDSTAKETDPQIILEIDRRRLSIINHMKAILQTEPLDSITYMKLYEELQTLTDRKYNAD